MDKTDAKPLRESKSSSSTSLKEKSTSSETRMKNATYPVQETSIPDSGLSSMGGLCLRSGSQSDVQNLPKTGNTGMGSMGDSGYMSNFSGPSSVNSQRSLSNSLQAGLTIADTEIDTENYYKMNHPKRGHCMIINNTLFKKETRMDERKGSDVDAANVYQLFRKLGFEVDLQNNQTTVQMLQHVILIASQNHTNCDCLVIVLLSHGDDGIIYGTDGFLRFDDLIAPLKGTGCTTLAGKPKLFFIQACRGTNLDDGVDVTDAVPDSDKPEEEEKKTYKIPAEADFLYAYSSPAGQFSFRNNANGSWFIQALCSVFEEHSKDKEIMQMLTRVNRHVALKFESRSRKKEHSGKKQVPSIVSMLTKELYFRTK